MPCKCPALHFVVPRCAVAVAGRWTSNLRRLVVSYLPRVRGTTTCFTYSPARFTYWGAVVVVVTVVVVDELVAGWPLTPPTFTTPGTLISPEGVVDSILTVYRI